ncbi:hypothetical protein [Nocardia sp. CS682]|uniref:hypothetical protein n=1 Tax=Nocardia sp. CS682 TaxID=1047172 RepID=UPI001074E7E4|nr:hypothetical protein [Nocardia sp. CS682]QBS44412.1 hypothetical protein DMB37_34335 [Nocardia sp. CS682]
MAVREQSADPATAAVLGEHTGAGDAVFGAGGQRGRGVVGTSTEHTAVEGNTETGIAVFGAGGRGGRGVVGVATNATAVEGYSEHGPGIWGQGTPAGHFVGDVTVTGTVTATDLILAGGDCAEDFDTPVAGLAPGSVLVIDSGGGLRQCERPYDRRVAGVVSGAGTLRPGIVLDRVGGAGERVTVALNGKAFCMVDADHGAVEVGDLLTTSPTPGYAMKATDPALAFGAVLGKALQGHADGRGLIPILVSLQ